MPNRKIDESIEMRAWTNKAVQEGVISQAQLRDYFIDNGWVGSIPTPPTLKKLLEKCGVVYVQGKWVNTKK